MFDWFGSLLFTLLLDAWLPYLVGIVVGLIIGYGARDLLTSRHDEHETTGAAYDACEEEPQIDDLAIAQRRRDNATARRLLNY
jgi:hypothetical protein